ncbi:hypothetical protein D7B24_000640 [Verticillium nonalfalfae]|uniref:Uncharacterized protein n=1 Tax=Verticillium nonalfalfae TaxID=1051616 RepID=A0A3M9YH73_9PEZI|nr:uncharacterized protein D7B24_000640 [Verticillium nonalfalfae]RNJ59923.1 hypothetical protein D7B24_000640 [Verticillium nonalfalfae]
MPFFSGRREPSPPPREPTPPPVEEPRRRGFFSGRRDPSPPRQAPVPQHAAVHEPPRKKGGLFGSLRDRSPSPVRDNHAVQHPSQDPHHRSTGGGGGLFHRNRGRSPSPARTSVSSLSSAGGSSYHTGPTRSGSVSTHGTRGKRGLLSKRGGRYDEADMDPSVLSARERVMGAEQAEKDADRALMAARESVAAAREEVRRVEEEAREDARRAKVKQYHAKEVSKRGKALGRFS